MAPAPVSAPPSTTDTPPNNNRATIISNNNNRPRSSSKRFQKTLTDQSDRTFTTSTTQMTSTTSLMSTSLRQFPSEEEEKREITMYDADDDGGGTSLADVMTANAAPSTVSPSAASSSASAQPQGEFKPATITPRTYSTSTSSDTVGFDNSSNSNNNNNNNNRPSRPPPGDLHASLTASDIFQETAQIKAQEKASRIKNNHHSSSSNASDESSILLDVSWGSNHFDKATLLSSFDDMLAVQDGRRIGGGPMRQNSAPIHIGGGGGGLGLDASSSNRSGITSNSGGRGGGGTSSIGSRNFHMEQLHQLDHHHHDGDDGGADPKSTNMVPPVFKTIRRDSKAENQQIVHVDGGGDDGNDISANLGFRASTGTNPHNKTKGILKTGRRRRRTTESNGSSSGASGGSSLWRPRRTSNASQNSDTMTGLQVLTASFQSARAQSKKNIFKKNKEDSNDNGDNGNNGNSVNNSGSLGGSNSGISGSNNSNNGNYGAVDNRPENSKKGPSVRIEQPPKSMITLTADGDNGNANIERGDPVFLRGNSVNSDGLSDSRRDAVNCSSRMDDSEALDSANAHGRHKEAEDTEIVAEVGGIAYLKASRSVWAMRIIVVITFIVVSVIVTVLTYTFFRDMESSVIQHNFMEVSTTLIGNTIKSLERKASSTRALSKTYTGILGMQEEKGLANHSPSVMLSPSTMSCVNEVLPGESIEWKTQWPHVTLPGYNMIGSAMLDVSLSRAAVFAPLLWGDEDVMEWEAYATSQALAPAKDEVTAGIRTSEGGSSLFTESTQPSSPRVPAWQIAPAVMMKEGIMWDYYSHLPYKTSIDRILSWNKERVNQGRRSLTTHADKQHLPVAATELFPCSDALLPLHLNPIPNTDPFVLGEDPFHGRNEHAGHLREGSTETLGTEQSSGEDFCSAIFYPVSSESNGNANISGVVAEMFSWSDIFKNIIHEEQIELQVDMESRLRLPDGSVRSQLASYVVSKGGATLIRPEELPPSPHEHMKQNYEHSFFPGDNITYSFALYPHNDVMCYNNGISKQPMFLSIIAACFFFLSVMVFFVYDYFVNYRQKVVVRTAAHSARIVHSLYPQFVRDNLFGSDDRKDGPPRPRAVSVEAANNSTQEYDEELPGMISSVATGPKSGVATSRRKGLKSKVSDFVDTPATQLKRFLTHPMPSREYDYNLCMEIGEMEPIAEVFEKTTVMLADIEGFTAWCSEREPSQVFRLLETVYREFDIEARKLGVFKVETVGDCYVAVTGLPDPRDDHAIVIAKYAVRCLLKFNVLTKRLEANLGPGTASLGMRFGLHSGPVTAGVLRGEKSRFQLFGDTINVASRMESTGDKNMIQVSQDTANLLNEAGKGHWLTPRDGPVSAKGKGSINTYWLQPNRRRPSMHGSLRQSMNAADGAVTDGSVPTVSLDRALRQSWKCIGIDNDSLVAKERLIRWNAAILESFLLKIVDNRNAHAPADDLLDQFIPTEGDKYLSFSEKLSEMVMFPETAYRDDYYGVSTDVAISSEAQIELLEYVARIASMYRDVPFHNFDHASHVTMSANKLLNRVCATFEDEEEDISSVAARTFGISADPLAQFVVVFSSLVHDVDHQGVPNAQLVKENDPLAAEFENRSVAEKRSITIAWNILMEDRFRELQSLIFVNGAEMRRFKQLLVNTVLATDIADKERSKRGKIRWQRAFHPSDLASQCNDIDESTSSKLDDVSLRSLKATLVFEQIMQASDVAHTMQHWETFKNWNKRLYKELSKGHREGRGAFDPRDNWYGGEIGFFDFYIIPLAKKLKECGVFGSAASEYLDYALKNRRRWEDEGHGIASKMIEENDALVADIPARIKAPAEPAQAADSNPTQINDGAKSQEKAAEASPGSTTDSSAASSNDDIGKIV